MVSTLLKKLKSIGFGLGVVFIVIILGFPVYWMIIVSLQTSLSQVVSGELNVIPRSISLINYYKVWFSKDYAYSLSFPRYMLNSLVTSGVSTGLAVSIALFAGYSLAQFRYFGREFFAQGTLYAYMIPSIILVIPLFLLVSTIHLHDTLVSLILVFITFELPYSTWLMQAYFTSIPKELEEAAMIDGCTRMGAFRRVTLPLISPGLVATTIFCFILSWNNVLYPMALINSDKKKPLSIGFIKLLAGDLTPWNGIMAASVMTAIPIVVLFFILQKGLVEGLTAGSIKG